MTPKENQVEDREELIALLKSIYDCWNGTTEKPIHGFKLSTKINRLNLVLLPDNKTGDIKIAYNFLSDVQIPENLVLNDEYIYLNTNNWSNYIFRVDGLKFNKKLVISNQGIDFKVIFNPDPDDIYVFENGRRTGFSAAIYVEANNIERTGTQRILLSREKSTELKEWIQINDGRVVEDCLNDPDWDLYEFGSFIKSHNSYIKLVLPATRFSSISYGLKGNGHGAYITGFPIRITLEGAIGDEIAIVGDDLEIKFDLETQSFNLDSLRPGNYDYDILSNNPEIIRISNHGKILIQSIEVKTNSKFCNLVKNENGQFNDKEKFDQLENLLRNNVVDSRSPPQFRRWVNQEIKLEVEPYSKLAITLMEYISFRGVMTKQSYDQNFSLFFDRLNVELDDSFFNVQSFRRFTLQKLEESCRISVKYGENYEIQEIRSIKPFFMPGYKRFEF